MRRAGQARAATASIRKGRVSSRPGRSVDARAGTRSNASSARRARSGYAAMRIAPTIAARAHERRIMKLSPLERSCRDPNHRGRKTWTISEAIRPLIIAKSALGIAAHRHMRATRMVELLVKREARVSKFHAAHAGAAIRRIWRTAVGEIRIRAKGAQTMLQIRTIGSTACAFPSPAGSQPDQA